MYGDCGCLRTCMHVCACVLVWWLCCVCMRFWPCSYGNCVCLRGCIHVCGCVCLHCGCVVFVCVSGNVCMVFVRVCVGVCMFVDVSACMVIVLCLHVSLATFVWLLCVFAWVYACL